MSSEVAQILAEMRVLIDRLGVALGAEQPRDVPTPAVLPALPAAAARGKAMASVAATALDDGLVERVYHAPPATYRVKGGVTLAIDGEKPHWVTTNAAGALLLRGCTGENTVGDLAARVAQRYDVAPERALEDASAFLQSLEAIDYVRQSPALAPAYRGRAHAVRLGRLADLFLFVTNDCNLRCTHCYVSSGDYVPPREMTTREILAVVDQARELGVGRFLVTGGEPFMVKDIYEIVRHITAESDLVLLTNGMFFTDRNLDRLEASIGRGAVSVQVSLDGPTAALHDAIRGKGAFDKAVAGVKRAIARGFDVAISSAVSRHTVEHMADVTRLVGQLGASTHHILWMQEWGRALDHQVELMIAPERVADVMRECKAVGDEIGVTIDNDASLRVRVQGKHGRKTDLCSCGWDSLAVFSDGQVYPCVWLAGAPGMECGSVREQPLGEIWRGSAVLDELRSSSVQNREGCSDCHLKFLCAGGSPCSSHFASLARRGKSDLHAAEPYCETYDQLTHDMLWELGLAGVEPPKADGGYEPPRLFNAMDGDGATCARPNTVAIDGAFEVGSYHCVCVLESDVEEGVALRPVHWMKVQALAKDPHDAIATFDAMGQSCVDLLLPMSKMVRALSPGQVLKIQTDDIAAREDLASWCRMTGNELLERIKREGFDHYYVRRGEAM